MSKVQVKEFGVMHRALGLDDNASKEEIKVALSRAAAEMRAAGKTFEEFMEKYASEIHMVN